MTGERIPDGGRRLLLAYYGDDFTGSTDVMEFLEQAGIPTQLYLSMPSSAEVAAEPGLRAVGLAGTSRTWSVDRMDAELGEVLGGLRALGASTIHYKICSTFDSSPVVGSIGRALEIARAVLDPPAIPMVIGSPPLGRYCVFGQLFARAAGQIHRLDRHPTLPVHPVTPMREADLLRHLAAQTDLPASLIDVLALDGPQEQLDERARDVWREAAVVLLDILRDEHLPRIGALLWSGESGPMPFVVGSSGIESSLIAQWRQHGWLDAAGPAPGAIEVPNLLVLSGSCAEATRLQLEHGRERGYGMIRLSLNHRGSASMDVVDAALDLLRAGRSAVVYTALGPGDCGEVSIAAELGDLLADMGRAILDRIRPPRVVVTGGDTSGRVATRLGIEALRFVTPIAPGAPLCRARSSDPTVDGLEISLKGGQVGSPAYLEQVRRGRA